MQHVSPNPQARCARCHTGKAEFEQQQWDTVLVVGAACVRRGLLCPSPSPVSLQPVAPVFAVSSQSLWVVVSEGQSSQLDLRGLQWLWEHLPGNTWAGHKR